MKVIYENTVKALGNCAEEFRAEKAPVTLAGLGHCTVKFTGQTNVELPGTIYVEDQPMPEIQAGTKIRILEG